MNQNRYIHLFEKYLANEATQSEIKELIDWLKGEYSEKWMSEEWNSADTEFSITEQNKKQEIFNRISREIDLNNYINNNSLTNKQSTRRKFLKTITKVAVAASLLFATSILGYKLAQFNTVNQDTVVAAGRGQKASVVLPDGSLVWLNSESQIKYGAQFADDQRVVSIEGEAYFEVAKDSERPFIVETSSLKVKVHGTSFNVNTYDVNSLKVSLLEGVVEIQPDHAKPQILQPNEVADYYPKLKKLEVSEGFANESIDWKYNRIRFKDEDLSSIMHKLERDFNVEITIADRQLRTRRFTGDFSQNETIEQILDVMSSTGAYTYTISGNKVRIN